MNVVVDGLMTNYSKAGKGKVIVFLHGWADNSQTFTQLAGILKARHTVISLDLPGFGSSQKPATAWNTDNFSDFVAHFLKKIDTPDVYAYITHSFGGTVAMNGLAKNTIKANKLVLMATAGVRGKNKPKKVALLGVAKISKLIFYPMPKNFKERLRQKMYGKIGSDLLVLGQMEPTFRKIINEDMRANAAELNLPTLLIYGSGDDQTPTEDGQIYHSFIKNSQLEIIDAAGHFVHNDEPEQVAKLVTEFLA